MPIQLRVTWPWRINSPATSLGQVAGDGPAQRAQIELVDADDFAARFTSGPPLLPPKDDGVVADPADDLSHVFAVEAKAALQKRGRMICVLLTMP